MAHLEYTLRGDADQFLTHLDSAILGRSITASAEGGTDQRIGDARMVVRSYERFGALGGNRVALTLSILAVGDELAVSAFGTGGSQAMFFKVNTLSESSFLGVAARAIEAFPG